MPALLYLLVTAGSGGARGWGIPMATDIAFAIGVVALLGPKVPSSLKLFLLTLAMVDDIGAMVVIAVFYADDLQPVFLLASGVVIGGILIIRRFGVCCRPAWLWVAACGLPPEPRACRPPLPGSVSPSPLFITELAFDPGARQDAAKIGVLAASTLAAALGATVLRQACRSATTGAS